MLPGVSPARSFPAVGICRELSQGTIRWGSRAFWGIVMRGAHVYSHG
jgi:hypothetical protein